MAKDTPFENGNFDETGECEKKFVKALTTCQIRRQRGFLTSSDFDENGEQKFTKVLAKPLMSC